MTSCQTTIILININNTFIDFFLNPIISFIWGIGVIDTENNADANAGAGQHATNGPNAKEETDLLTTIHITKKQIGKISLRRNNYFMYIIINWI